MIRNSLLIVVIVIATSVVARWMFNAPVEHLETANGEEHQEILRGPHHGRLLDSDLLSLEVTIFESGVPPEFHIYPYAQGQPTDPSLVDLDIKLHRTGDVIDEFSFVPRQDYLRGDNIVLEPHSFDVSVVAQYQGKTYRWQYENYEGRTEIPTAFAERAGIATELAGPATIEEKLRLTGRVEIDPNRVSEIRPRFPGVVESISAEVGDIVEKGQRLLTVQSNESLQTYRITAPISGTIVRRSVQAGEAVSGNSLFTIVDLSVVWVELDVFAQSVSRVKVGQSVSVKTLAGVEVSGSIDWLIPLASHKSQSIHARVSLANPDGSLRPGEFVSASVEVAEHAVPLAVKRSAVQSFRDFQVVYARFGDIYEVRMLEPGRKNDEWLEVVGGLSPGTEYVTENSYLIKADIEKSGASHDH